MEKILIWALILLYTSFGANPTGFNNAPWGGDPQQVKNAAGAKDWQKDPTVQKGFPEQLDIQVYKSSETITGYRSVVKYYFYENKLFQVTVTFNFDEMKKYDFNYNVFRSVNEYYNYIRSRTLVFVNEIYALLSQKYGKKEPVFKGLDPRYMFVSLDKYLKQERWNLRYNPYDYYLHIKTAAYARWDFPKTKVIFSVAVNAAEKRFEYDLSLSSTDMERSIQKAINESKMKGL